MQWLPLYLLAIKKGTKNTKVLDRLSHTDKISHLIIVGIELCNKKEETMHFHEIYMPIFEKKKKSHSGTLKACSSAHVYYLKIWKKKKTWWDYLRQTLKHILPVKKKNKHIHFLVKRTGCLVIRIHQHSTFDQSKFKKDFVVMNQKARQKATYSVQQDFYKLLNNSNFDINCRNNNINNWILKLIYDKINEIVFFFRFYKNYGGA